MYNHPTPHSVRPGLLVFTSSAHAEVQLCALAQITNSYYYSQKLVLRHKYDMILRYLKLV